MYQDVKRELFVMLTRDLDDDVDDVSLASLADAIHCAERGADVKVWRTFVRSRTEDLLATQATQPIQIIRAAAND